MAQNGCRALLCLASNLANVISEAVSEVVRLKFEFWKFFKVLYPATCKCFVVFNVVLCIIWTSTIP